LDRAQDAAETSDSNGDALSGPFTCSIGRAGGFWSDTHLALGNAKGALRYVDFAVRDFESTPTDRRNFDSERMARCQQVKAHLLAEELDGAREALMPVLNTAPEMTRDHWWWRPGWHKGRSFYTWHITFPSSNLIRQIVQLPAVITCDSGHYPV
jgi:hypothetical protein